LGTPVVKKGFADAADSVGRKSTPTTAKKESNSTTIYYPILNNWLE
jgi:hypothetical protein